MPDTYYRPGQTSYTPRDYCELWLMCPRCLRVYPASKGCKCSDYTGGKP